MSKIHIANLIRLSFWFTITALLISASSVTSSHAQSRGDNALELRQRFYAAADDQEAAQAFFDELELVDEPISPLTLGYKGMASLLRARDSLWPHLKFHHFVRGRELLERAIARAPENVELRFLRYTVQLNAPVFLNYRMNLEQDKAQLLTAVVQNDASNIDADLRDRILEFMLLSEDCTSDERAQLKSVQLSSVSKESESK